MSDYYPRVSNCCGANYSVKKNTMKRDEDDPLWIYLCHECWEHCKPVDAEEYDRQGEGDG